MRNTESKNIVTIWIVWVIVVGVLLMINEIYAADITVNRLRKNADDKTVYFTISTDENDHVTDDNDNTVSIDAVRYHADIPLDADASQYLNGISERLADEITSHPDFSNTHDYTGSLTDEALALLEADQKAYIHGHYDLGTLLSFKSLMDKDDTPQDVKDMLVEVEVWINTVLAYYYGKKDEIRAAADPIDVEWDFATFDATRPAVDLEHFF